MSRLRKTAGNFNIPEAFIALTLAPQEAQDMKWREVAEGNRTVEIWSTNETSFVVLEGDFSDNEWSQQDVSLVKEFDKLDDAIELVRSTYIFVSDGEEVQQNEAPAAEEAPKTASLSRLRKN